MAGGSGDIARQTCLATAMGLRDFLRDKAMPSGGITVDQVLTTLSKGGVLVDVRTLREYEAGHAPGARLVEVKDLLEDPWLAVHAGDPFAEPHTPLVLICDTGLRSGMAAKQILTTPREYPVDFLAGGLRAWRHEGQLLLPGPPRRR